MRQNKTNSSKDEQILLTSEPSPAHEGQGEVNPSETAREQVAVLAYELWESHGRPQRTNLDDWFQAERRLRRPT